MTPFFVTIHNFNALLKIVLRFLASPILSAAFFSAAKSCWIPADGLVIINERIHFKFN